jgi:hypothetical protein
MGMSEERERGGWGAGDRELSLSRLTDCLDPGGGQKKRTGKACKGGL